MNFSALLPLVGVLPMLVVAGFLYYQKYRYRHHINPLTQASRRPPGTELGRQLAAMQISALEPMLVTVFGSYVSIIYYQQAVLHQGGAPSLFVIGFTLLLFLGSLCYGIWGVAKIVGELRVCRLGYECEIAVGQELNLLMLSGCYVIHDLQCGKFNIDHVVVGANGVFAVETKGRSKRGNSRSDGKAEYRVRYENNTLYFPGWQEREPIEQAINQANWLSKSLSAATGSQVDVAPIVVLPGWFIENKTRPVVPVLALGQVNGFLTRGAKKLSEQQIQRIVYQLDQRSRDLLPGEMVRASDR